VTASAGGQCDHHRPSTAHDAIQVGLADGSVRSVAPDISKQTWARALTPNGGDVLGPDW
jgi:hypothetical protein